MWLQEPISLQVRDGNIYTSLPIPEPVVSSGGFFSEDTWFESQPVLTDEFPSFPPGKSHDRSLKQAMINSSSLSSGLLHAALFHDIQWQTTIAIYTALLCTYNHRPTLSHYIYWVTNTCLVSGGKHQTYRYRLPVEPEHIALLNIHFHPCGNTGCSGPCKQAYRNAHTEIQQMVYMTTWIYLLWFI